MHNIGTELLGFNIPLLCVTLHILQYLLLPRPVISRSVIMDHLALSHSEPSCDLMVLSHLQRDNSKCNRGTGRVKGERKGSFIFLNSLFSKGLEFKNKTLDLSFNSRMASEFFLRSALLDTPQKLRNLNVLSQLVHYNENLLTFQSYIIWLN